eukprot:1843736-Pyramimonas_sp.AAC.1
MMQHSGSRPYQQCEVGNAPGYTRAGLRAEPNSKSPTQRAKKEGGRTRRHKRWFTQQRNECKQGACSRLC